MMHKFLVCLDTAVVLIASARKEHSKKYANNKILCKFRMIYSPSSMTHSDV